MYIIPGVLDEEIVSVLTDKELFLLSKCSPEPIQRVVFEYLENEGADVKCKERIEKAYKAILDENEFLESDKTKEQVVMLRNINMSQLNISTPINEIKGMIQAIDDIFSNENAVPYIAPVGVSELEVFLDELENNKSPLAKEFKKIMQKSKSYFKDSRFAHAKGTVVKKVIKNPETYEILRRGGEFLLKKKEQGLPPETWRFI